MINANVESKMNNKLDDNSVFFVAAISNLKSKYVLHPAITHKNAMYK